MDITRLRYFCTVVNAGSLARAAESLRISPAALSKSIRILEQEVDAQLVLPSGRGIAISPVGRRLAAQGQELLHQWDSLRDKVAEQSRIELPIRVGSFEVFTTYFLGYLVSEFLRDKPITTHELIPGHLEQALVDDRIDLGLTYIPVPHRDLDHTKVATVRMSVFGIAGAFKNLDIAAMPFAIPTSPIQGMPTKVQGLDGWPEKKSRRNVVFRVGLMESALALCRRGLAVAYLPTFIAKLHNQEHAKEFQLIEVGSASAVSTRQDVYIIRRRSDPEDAATRQIAKALRAICR